MGVLLAGCAVALNQGGGDECKKQLAGYQIFQGLWLYTASHTAAVYRLGGCRVAFTSELKGGAYYETSKNPSQMAGCLGRYRFSRGVCCGACRGWPWRGLWAWAWAWAGPSLRFTCTRLRRPACCGGSPCTVLYRRWMGFQRAGGPWRASWRPPLTALASAQEQGVQFIHFELAPRRAAMVALV